MWRIYECLTIDHDPWLLLIAVFVCVLGSFASMHTAIRARVGTQPVLWTSLAAVSCGLTVWSTHFISMLAFRTEVPISFDLALTVLSALIGVFGFGIGLFVIRRHRDRPSLFAAGAVVGISISCLHYIGMSGVTIPGRISFDMNYVAASIIAAIILGGLTFSGSFCLRAAPRILEASIGLILTTVALHFTGMAAVSIQLGLYPDNFSDGVSRDLLIAAVAVASLSIILIGTCALLVDNRVTKRLAEEAKRFRTLSDSAFEGVAIFKGQQVVDCNKRLEDLLQTDRDKILTTPILDWVVLESRARAMRLFTDMTFDDVEQVNIMSARGRKIVAEIQVRPIMLANDEAALVLVVRDVTAQRQSEKQIEYLAYHDQLTGLPNQRMFDTLAAKSVATADRHGQKFALMMLDLDGFKAVNDVRGHKAGDEVLQRVGQLLQGVIRNEDVVARRSGDEFVILQVAAGQPEQADALASRILQAFDKPLHLEDGDEQVNASIGIAIYPDDGDNLDVLMRNADTAMYEAKKDGKATSRFFKAKMDEDARYRRQVESQLKQALANNQLELHFQPLINSKTGRVMSFEALVRWEDPIFGRMSPGEFIPIAEQTGLIIPLGDWALEEACRVLTTLPDDIRVAVNLSPVQFRRPGLKERVIELLDKYGLSGSRLELEVTESLLIEDTDSVCQTLSALKELGVGISMDDFGTGFSSLSYLRSFPFDKLKIDRVFIQDMQTGEKGHSIVAAITALAKNLGMQVVAEGVEEAEQALALDQLDCDLLQGFLYARPMASNDISGFLSTHHAGAEAQVLVSAAE